ncbi:autotransporter domain-containing protein [Pseudomonas segetis]|uniref:Autotransporter beta-domain-containing protein n=1 Tax=Pseudomonas segetis TaxID=298908 RepID=A0A239F9L5_9PSED|nr:autotransporter domain-containing protein [Pseudomonas segetis]SNS53431.1 Autotransporter beta-domain-containing protein [Pseudomonas segetis]
MATLAARFTLLVVIAAPTAHAELMLDRDDVEDRVNGVLSLMSYSMTLDLASSSLQIKDGSSGNPSIKMTQLGGGATMSKSFPLYLEGAAAYSRYDPRFVATDGAEQRSIPVKWNSVSATGGVGWDFPISDEVVVRPIASVGLGYMTSDLNAARIFINRKTNKQIKFLDDGQMSALGLGGAMMLDWERVRPDYEADIELRYTYMNLQQIGGDEAINGEVTAETANLWSRWRAPTGWVVMQRPLRYVLEFSHSEYLGDQRGALGFDRLSTFGLGVEFDSSAYDIFISRTRLVLRQMVGDNVSGLSLGLAVSF